jgi:hypothetical protein
MRRFRAYPLNRLTGRRFRHPARVGPAAVTIPGPCASQPPWHRCVRPIRRSTNRRPANGKETEAHRCLRDPRRGSRRTDPAVVQHRWEMRPAAPVCLPFSHVTVVYACRSVRDRSRPGRCVRMDADRGVSAENRPGSPALFVRMRDQDDDRAAGPAQSRSHGLRNLEARSTCSWMRASLAFLDLR